MKLNPYLTFDGNAHEALDFYATALDGEVEMTMRFDEMPDTSMVPKGMEGRLAHGRIKFGDDVVMVSDTMGHEPFKGHSGFSMQTAWDSVEDAHAAFAKLSNGGAVIMPIEETFWAKAFGTCRDKFGVEWMVNCEIPS